MFPETKIQGDINASVFVCVCMWEWDITECPLIMGKENLFYDRNTGNAAAQRRLKLQAWLEPSAFGGTSGGSDSAAADLFSHTWAHPSDGNLNAAAICKKFTQTRPLCEDKPDIVGRLQPKGRSVKSTGQAGINTSALRRRPYTWAWLKSSWMDLILIYANEPAPGICLLQMTP